MGCRERATRNELLRVVAGVDDEGRPAVVPDPARTAPGRGAHLHPTTACFDLAVRRKAFGRALRVRSALDTAAVARVVADRPAARTDPAAPAAPAPPGADAQTHPAPAP